MEKKRQRHPSELVDLLLRWEIEELQRAADEFPGLAPKVRDQIARVEAEARLERECTRAELHAYHEFHARRRSSFKDMNAPLQAAALRLGLIKSVHDPEYVEKAELELIRRGFKSYDLGRMTPLQWADLLDGSDGEEFTPEESDIDILKALSKRAALTVADFLEVPSAGMRKVKTRLPALEKARLVHRPNGPNKGWAITRAGRRILEAHDAHDAHAILHDKRT